MNRSVRRTFRIFGGALALLTLCLNSQPSLARSPLLSKSPEEAFLDVGRYQDLPEYCRVRLTRRDLEREGRQGSPQGLSQDLSRQWDRWEAVLGGGSRHVHHYCWGLQKLSNGMTMAEVDDRSRMLRRSLLRQAVKEFEYVLLRVGQDFPLLPEILVNQAKALVALGEEERAVTSLMGAIRVRNDYGPAYAELAAALRRQGQHAEAERILDLAVRNGALSPDTASGDVPPSTDAGSRDAE